MTAGSSKKAYSIRKTLTKITQAKSSVISDADGNPSTLLAVRILKEEKSPGEDNVPSDLIKHVVEATTAAMTKQCQQI
ncbi:hypothetical protein DPMN_006383 [Dreissena polymorpha]|uniref:Uncharacterized protein n=1 Tax=Dreissena polymorpha TaxID=45954 RepID=A0A9D4MU10_DREPO|nr:hypothetical protein DPMN_006383 [Dreissena polymorpha]